MQMPGSPHVTDQMKEEGRVVDYTVLLPGGVIYLATCRFGVGTVSTREDAEAAVERFTERSKRDSTQAGIAVTDRAAPLGSCPGRELVAQRSVTRVVRAPDRLFVRVAVSPVRAPAEATRFFDSFRSSLCGPT
jgi:hypothetical protein